MSKIRVLVVDDSVVIRRLVTDALQTDPALEVAGVAANGRIALAKISQSPPDVVTLDVEMPEMGGLETLKEIRKLYPRLPVIMFSTLTVRGAECTLDALAAGANDYVAKPANVGSVGEALQRLREDLIPKIKHFCGKTPEAVAPPRRPGIPVSKPPASPLPTIITALEQRIDVIAIGVSTGGPDALLKLVPELPENLPVPIVTVQHMPPIFTKLLADRLDVVGHIRVKEAAPGDRLEPGGMWIAPGDFHLTVGPHGTDVILKTHQGPRENSCRPAVDVLFRSVAETYGSRALVVILTGMGQDGLRGCEAIHDVGGQAIAQDEATSVVWGMPGFIARAGLANAILPLNRIAAEITRRAFVGRAHSSAPLAVTSNR